MSIKQAIEALEEAIEAVRFFHGPIAWEAYRDHSPEMKRWSAALAALRSMPAQDDALNTLCKMMHSGEEVEGDDGLAMLVPMDLWNEAQEAIELLVGEDDATPHTAPLNDDELWKLWNAQGSDAMDQQEAIAFARAIERAVLGRGGEQS